jgi:hypothetical protein
MERRRRMDIVVAGLAFASITVACQQSMQASTPDKARAAMKTVEVFDPVLGQHAYSVTIPADWVLDGSVVRAHFGASFVFRASSRDGLTGLQSLPNYNWVSSTDPGMDRFYQGVRVMRMQPMHAAEFMKRYVLPEARPGAKVVVENEAMPDFGEIRKADENQNAQFAAMAAKTGARPNHVTSEGARVRIQYDFNGHPVEESVVLVTSVTEMPAPHGMTYLSQGLVRGARAPRGKLDEVNGVLNAIGRSVTADPRWVQAQDQFVLQNAQAQQRAIVARAGAYRRANQAVFERSMNNTARMEADRHRGAQATADHMGDVQGMVDPATGRTGKVSNQFVNSYVDQDGNVVHTNSATYNPNAELPGNWTQLQPLKP